MSINAYIADLPVAMSLRLALAGLICMPIGLFWAGAIGPWGEPRSAERAAAPDDPAEVGTAERAAEGSRTVLWASLLVLGGFLIGRGLLPQWGVANLLCLSAIVASIPAWVRVGLPERDRSLRSVLRRAGLAAPALAVAAAVWSDGYRPELSARVLFDAHVFQAKRSGLPKRWLTQLDESRCLGVWEGSRSTFTVWKRRGNLWMIRESGVPKSVVSTDSEICPHYAPEMLHAVIPLCLQPQAYRVLLLGLGGGSQLEACLAFPTQQVVCIEPDRRLIELTRKRLAASGPDLLRDDRLRLVVADPAWGLACSWGTFDVILDAPDVAALAHSAGRWTADYYRRAARHLSTKGLYCQRFQSLDCGARSVQSIVETLQSVFPTVTVLETAPGEMLLVA
ncbi:MAG TPA: hypothetical protein EYP14_01355, partial [Planctomycetaceae bacterium]|nr:hypothetical protein [Planctomycetaceae bacterium]